MMDAAKRRRKFFGRWVLEIRRWVAVNGRWTLRTLFGRWVPWVWVGVGWFGAATARCQAAAAPHLGLWAAVSAVGGRVWSVGAEESEASVAVRWSHVGVWSLLLYILHQQWMDGNIEGHGPRIEAATTWALSWGPRGTRGPVGGGRWRRRGGSVGAGGDSEVPLGTPQGGQSRKRQSPCRADQF